MKSEYSIFSQIKTSFPFWVWVFILLIVGFGGSDLRGQAAAPQSVFSFLTRQEVSRMTLEADFTELMSNRRLEDYIPAAITLEDGRIFKAQIKPRGRYRRKVCEVPPLKIKFSKKSLQAEGLDSLNEVKLVLPCTDNVAGEELIVKEYLIYRMFERLTAASVKARLVRMTLRDTHVERSFSKRQMLCLLLEDEEETAARLSGVEREVYGISPDSLQMNQAALTAVFQYMIGNTDWDISMMRNCRLIQSRESGKVLVLPYDFDFSGLVGAPYASPSAESGVRTVHDRFLMADGISEDAIKRAVQVIRSARKDLMDICRSRYLSKEQSDSMMQYLETFFQGIAGRELPPVLMPYSSE
jgi:hypothetical protein